MWEAIQNVLISKNGLAVILLIIVIVIMAIRLGKHGLLNIHTKHVSIGDDERERTILREQCDYVHTYLMGLSGKVNVMLEGKLQYNGYFTKYILEVIYDEFVRWITFNHISTEEAYIHAKQMKLCSLIYSMDINQCFKTREFQERMNKWTSEVIHELVHIRKLYIK